MCETVRARHEKVGEAKIVEYLKKDARNEEAVRAKTTSNAVAVEPPQTFRDFISHHDLSLTLDIELQDLMFSLLGFGLALGSLISVTLFLLFEWKCLHCAIVVKSA